MQMVRLLTSMFCSSALLTDVLRRVQGHDQVRIHLRHLHHSDDELHIRAVCGLLPRWEGESCKHVWLLTCTKFAASLPCRPFDTLCCPMAIDLDSSGGKPGKSSVPAAWPL